MRNIRGGILVIAVLFLAFAPASVSAQLTLQNQGQNQAQAQGQSGFKLFPIVTCGTSTTELCTPCGLLDVAENTVKFVTIGVTGPVAALLFIYAGFLLLFYGANPSMVTRAKTVMTNTVYGVAIILMSWIIVVQLIKAIAPNSAATRWYEFSCPQFLGGLGQAIDLGAPEPGNRNAFTELGDSAKCDESGYEELAASFNSNANPKAVDPDLQELVDCLLKDPVVKAAHDPNQLFTFENSRPICNVIRGFNNCGPCQHSLYSCHYGGGNGSTGAQAVDFNFIGQFTGVPVEATVDGKKIVVRNERDLAKQLIRAANAGQCNFKMLNFEGSHTHISALSCDGDGQTTSVQGL